MKVYLALVLQDGVILDSKVAASFDTAKRWALDRVPDNDDSYEISITEEEVI